MFNSYNSSQKVEINAVSGTLVKNYKDSVILRFHMRSELGKAIMSDTPTMSRQKKNKYGSYRSEDDAIVVLQVMLCGEGELIAEVMWKDEFDKMFEMQIECERE